MNYHLNGNSGNGAVPAIEPVGAYKGSVDYVSPWPFGSVIYYGGHESRAPSASFFIKGFNEMPGPQANPDMQFGSPFVSGLRMDERKRLAGMLGINLSDLNEVCEIEAAYRSSVPANATQC